jgi:hypothetical protein
MKNFISLHRSRPRTKQITDIVAIFSYILDRNYICKDIRLSNPAQATIPYCCRSWSNKGGGSLSYLLIFSFVQMTKNKENASKAKYSNHTSTPTERNTVQYSKFLIEKNAKNKAYFFILSHGLLEHFSKFCKNYHSSNPHTDCVEYLLSKI